MNSQGFQREARSTSEAADRIPHCVFSDLDTVETVWSTETV